MIPLFETMLCEDGRVRLLDRHLARLRATGVPDAVVAEVARVVAVACAEGGPPIVLRIDVGDAGVQTRPRPPKPATAVRLWPLGGYDPEDRARELKQQDRTWAERGEGEAAAVGADEPLFVSPEGLVGETARANIFAIARDGAVVTPPVAGILPGVTRSWAVEETGAAARPLPLEELVGARAAFLTTAGRGIVRVAAVAGVELGDDPLIACLQGEWRQL